MISWPKFNPFGSIAYVARFTGKGRHLFALRSFVYRTVWLLGSLLPTSYALADTCSNAGNIVLTAEVSLTEEERRWLDSQPPLQVAVFRGATPLAEYDEDSGTYHGISLDVFCFIAEQLDLRYKLVEKGRWGFPEQMHAVQQGELDMVMPISRQREREVHGLFTDPYFRTYYVTVSRRGQLQTLENFAGQSSYRVGVLGNAALTQDLQETLPDARLRIFDSQTDREKFYHALREGEVDILLQNKEIFVEDRYRYGLFDLDVTQILFQFPREYGFYFSDTESHAQLVTVFNRYLGNINVADSVMRHEGGEQRMVERYLQQQKWLYWQGLLIVTTTLLLLLALFYFWHYRRLSLRLDVSRTKILAQRQALVAANEELEELSMTDSLTGLANRRRFDEQLLLEHANHRRTRRPLSLLVVDMDHFKQVNDHLGHGVGDDYLRAAAKVLGSFCRRPGDLLARYGGEEMACLLPETSEREAVMLAERMREALASLRLPNPATEPGYLTLSIGVATLSEQDKAPEELLVEADAQLYQAKGKGRNRVSPEESQLDDAS